MYTKVSKWVEMQSKECLRAFPATAGTAGRLADGWRDWVEIKHRLVSQPLSTNTESSHKFWRALGRIKICNRARPVLLPHQSVLPDNWSMGNVFHDSYSHLNSYAMNSSWSPPTFPSIAVCFCLLQDCWQYKYEVSCSGSWAGNLI